MEVAYHQLALELALMNGARHRVTKVMRGVCGTRPVNHQRQPGVLPVHANDANVLPTATEKPRRFHEPKRTTHAALIGTA